MTRRELATLGLILLIALFLRLSAGVSLLPVTLISAGVAGGVWWLAQRHLNRTAALVAGLVCAVNLWAVAYSGFLLVALTQVMVLVTTALFLHSVPARRWAVIGLMVTVGLYAVLIAGSRETVGIGWQPETLAQLIQVVSSTGLEHALAVESPEALLAQVPRPGEVWTLLLVSTALVGFAALWFRSRVLLAVMAAWLVLPVIVFSVNQTAIHPVYLTPFVPIIALLIGAGLAWLIRLLPGGRLTRLVILMALAAVLLSQALWWRGALRYMSSTPLAEVTQSPGE